MRFNQAKQNQSKINCQSFASKVLKDDQLGQERNADKKNPIKPSRGWKRRKTSKGKQRLLKRRRERLEESLEKMRPSEKAKETKRGGIVKDESKERTSWDMSSIDKSKHRQWTSMGGEKDVKKLEIKTKTSDTSETSETSETCLIKH